VIVEIRTDPETDAQRACRQQAWTAIWQRLFQRDFDDSEYGGDLPEGDDGAPIAADAPASAA
jgi:hypothetical protein